MEDTTDKVSLVNAKRLTPHWYNVAYYRRRDYYYRETPELCSGGDVTWLSDIETCSRMDAEYVEIPVTAYGDYLGGSCEQSNFRSLIRDFGQATFVETHGDFCSRSLLMPMEYGEIITPADLWPDQSAWEVRKELCDIFRNLAEQYPLYDEEDESSLVSDAAWEAWEDQGLRSDVRRDLEDASESSEAMEDMLDTLAERDEDGQDNELLRQAYYRLTSELGNEYPYMETGGGIYFPDHKMVIEALAEELWRDRCAAFAPPAEQATLI